MILSSGNNVGVLTPLNDLGSIWNSGNRMWGPPENSNREILEKPWLIPPHAFSLRFRILSQVLPYSYLISSKLSSKRREWCRELFANSIWQNLDGKKNGLVAIHSTVLKQHTASPNIIAYCLRRGLTVACVILIMPQIFLS